MNQAIHLYVISFTVGSESGLAMVAANNDRDAFQILKNGGSRCGGGYNLIQIRDIGMSSSCVYGLLLESFVNANEAYDAILEAANHFLKGDPGDNIWTSMYVDDEFYLHLVEDKHTISPHITFDQETGYLTIT